ncbi:GntR family transcriptional regulator [Rossellomorea vietnamensis]|uniref:GntR family transcriptional regulator n=1 Tax=Rossellomorea vietnamensis TaxID=218284 RepID=A0A5D4NK76_9BACI|nr:GntR family transcriptional regulator [Rossellomorea vietnamensis]TYS13332.1 GntR family transcriptional regulator [Rossellomorea vietnamensis]
MSQPFDDNRPIFIQIKERIEDQIVNDQLQEHDQIPSTTQLVKFYKINHLTIAKGINLLVDAGIIYKKRGVGMFVAQGAKELLVEHRKEGFVDQYMLPLIQEAEKLGISENELVDLLKQLKGRDKK